MSRHRPKTTRQQAVYDLLLFTGERTTREVVQEIAREHPGYTDVPAALIDALPRSTGTARDVLEALVRRREVVRSEGVPARYSAVVA